MENHLKILTAEQGVCAAHGRACGGRRVAARAVVIIDSHWLRRGLLGGLSHLGSGREHGCRSADDDRLRFVVRVVARTVIIARVVAPRIIVTVGIWAVVSIMMITVMMTAVIGSNGAEKQARARADGYAFAGVASAIVTDDAAGDTAEDSTAHSFAGKDLRLCGYDRRCDQRGENDLFHISWLIRREG